MSVLTDRAYRGRVNSRWHRRAETPVQTVTSAPMSVRDDSAERMHRYLFSMGVRTACFILAVFFFTVLHWTIVTWICIGAAAVLPYIAVVMANATRSRRIDQVGAVTPSGQPFTELSQRAWTDPASTGESSSSTSDGPSSRSAGGTGSTHGSGHGRRQ